MPRPVLRRKPKSTVKEMGGVDFGNARLTPKEAAILREYMKDFNGKDAAIRAGCAEKSAAITASTVLRQPHVLMAMHHELVERRKKADIEVDEVIKYWWSMATADVREFNPLRWRCCRFCWGQDNLYQFTPNEWRELQIKHQMSHRHLPDEEKPILDALGGEGFDQMRDPMRGPEWEARGFAPTADRSCPECNGKGTPRIEEIDLNKLSYGASLIFDGVKVHPDGMVEFKVNSNRSEGMKHVAQLLGFIRPRKPIWAADFADLTPEELDALLTAAEARGFISKSDYFNRKLIDAEVEPE